MSKSIFVTGGAGFIGSEVVRQIVDFTDWNLINIDKLTYAGNLESLISIADHPKYHFEKVDICDGASLKRLFEFYEPDAVINLAAESHVDRSIDDPDSFIQTNIVGTYTLLESAYEYWYSSTSAKKNNFRILHVSTDEVYGSLGESGLFTEETPYRPNSPYSASKASSDHLVRAWYHTYELPVFITNCSNNYGPYQFPEKFIPLVILNALKGEKLPIYGNGENIRDWLFVSDHVRALRLILEQGVTGETYNIGGNSEMTNNDVVNIICDVLDEMAPDFHNGISHYRELITYVPDRPGHDYRYAIDISKIKQKLGWEPEEIFENGIRKTIQWYMDNQEWCQHVHEGSYRGERLGIRKTP